MRLLHEIAIFQTVKSKVIISLFETVRLSVSISLRNLYNSLNSIKEIVFQVKCNRVYVPKEPAVCLLGVQEGVVDDNILYSNSSNCISADKKTSCMVLNNHTVSPPQVCQSV